MQRFSTWQSDPTPNSPPQWFLCRDERVVASDAVSDVCVQVGVSQHLNCTQSNRFPMICWKMELYTVAERDR